jgi:nucleoside-diphosphate-sugar epimerase
MILYLIKRRSKLKIFISGIGGVLGSTLARSFLSIGWEVSGNDKLRIEEAWKLEGIKKDIKYLWKSSTDLETEDIEGNDVLIDCALESADRPFGISSPTQTLLGNLLPPLRVLETIKKCKNKPVAIYPSSFNVFYGHNPDKIINEETPPLTSTVYGLTKASAEHLYMVYNKAYDMPTIVTRVGSAFGPKMRSDELIGRLIIYCIKNKDFYLRSPQAKRLWCYAEDIVEFYKSLARHPDNFIGKVLHCAGNKDDEILANIEIAERVKNLTGSDIKIIEGIYDAGEMINGKPIDFKVDSSRTKKLVGWYPKHSVDDGLTKTIDWFNNNIHRYTIH